MKAMQDRPVSKGGIYNNIVNVLASPRRVPTRIVLITALGSYLLQIGAIVQGQPLYLIALFTLLPWIPLVAFEGIWKVRHYGWIAVFFIIVILQVGHLGEHVTQVAQISAFDGTLSCPPPVDNDLNANMAVENGLRAASDGPTYTSSSYVIKPDNATGLPAVGATGEQIRGPAACGVFGQLDLEIVHLIWEVIGWVATIALLTKFRRNIWLWIALLAVSLHSVEHLFISWIFFVDNDLIFEGFKQLWGTTADGNIVTAVPVGKDPTIVSFYDAGGKSGVMAKGGLMETLVPGLAGKLPQRAWLHFWYNSFVFVPTVIAFLVEARRVYNEYLAEALPSLSEDQLAETSAKLAIGKYSKGEVVMAQGDEADGFYILTKGSAEVLRTDDSGVEEVIGSIESGQFFGEMGLMSDQPRSATIRATSDIEVLMLDRNDFTQMIDDSERSKFDIEKIMAARAESHGVSTSEIV